MKCEICYHENRSGVRFCENCGQPLEAVSERVCASCGARNRPDVRFCEECGQPLEAASEWVCASCGARNRPDVRFCEECGQPLKAVSEGICASCGARNRLNVRFCEECGEPLREAFPALTCAACGHTNRSGMRFCEECGQPLGRRWPRVLPIPLRVFSTRVASFAKGRRLLWTGLALLVLILALRVIYNVSLLASGPSYSGPPSQISEEEALVMAEAQMQELTPWLVDVQPSVEEAQFGDDQGYLITYQRDAQVMIDNEMITFKQMLVVSINAVTEEVSVAISP